MAAKVYTFHISYAGLEDRIWRDVEVSSNYSLDKLGYMVLALFETMAYHPFEFYYNGKRYKMPKRRRTTKNSKSIATLSQLALKIGDKIQMNYDFGTTQTFWLELVSVEDMQRGRGNHYPYIIDGAGHGIIDDCHYTELAKLIEKIDQNGNSDDPILFDGRIIYWDFYRFDISSKNYFLKTEIMMIAEGGSPFFGRSLICWPEIDEGNQALELTEELLKEYEVYGRLDDWKHEILETEGVRKFKS